jgi:hypothetical protein
MPELIQTLTSLKKVEEEKRRFTAMLQGVDLGESEQTSDPTFDDIKARALGINASSDDVVSLQGQMAAEAGFGIGAGLGYIKE